MKWTSNKMIGLAILGTIFGIGYAIKGESRAILVFSALVMLGSIFAYYEEKKEVKG